jgi:hypothetical protein
MLLNDPLASSAERAVETCEGLRGGDDGMIFS